MARILVTGAAGQIGSELAGALRQAYGASAVLASDIRDAPREVVETGPFVRLDCLDGAAVDAAVRRHRADTIYHLAAILSARAERDPQKAYRVNMDGLYNVLETAREHGCAVFTPSSIAAFGEGTPREGTPQDTIQRPATIYGVTKVAGELLCDYYFQRFRVDTRGLRYPGIISHVTEPGGGTTDYAVEIFHDALEHGRYTCFLRADTRLDLMYMPDAIRAAMELMEADPARLRHRNAFNITAMQLTPARLADAIRAHLPHFEIGYEIDPLRQAIADSWPRAVDDSAAREEWGWRPAVDIETMTADMLEQVAAKLGRPLPPALRAT